MNNGDDVITVEVPPLSDFPLTVSASELMHEQQSDPSLKEMFGRVLLATEVNNVATGDSVQNGLLFRKWMHLGCDSVGEAVFQLVVPAKFHPLVLKVAHDDGQHFGVRKTYLRTLKHFFWPHMKRDVSAFIKTCHVCQLTGKLNQSVKPAPLQPIPAMTVQAPEESFRPLNPRPAVPQPGCHRKPMTAPKTLKDETCDWKKVLLTILTFVVLLAILVTTGYFIKLQKNENLTISPPRAMPKEHPDCCTVQPLLPKEDNEENRLIKSIAWPETPSLPTPLSLDEASCPAKSTFTILPQRGGGQWHVGDKLKVLIKMCDFQGRPKKSGGDVLFTRLHNPTLGAGVAGKVEDHLNGTYSAVFSLLWEGSAWVEVTLVHPSEAVTVLRRLNSEQSDRVVFQSLFSSGSVSETTICNIFLHPTEQPLCNYTDLHTGDPWFCFKPKNLNCDTRINHSKREVKQNLKANEEKLFQLGVNMKVSIPASGSSNVTVLPREKDQAVVSSSNVESGPSGYYYQGAWQTLSGAKVQQFNTPSAITQCLKGKVVHLYGDSTVRQWFEYFNGALPDLKEFDLHSHKQNGPFMAIDIPNNILMNFRCHGPPFRCHPVPISEFRYIANELDNVVGGTNTVVIFGIWAHFGSYPVEVYIRRLQSIRKAVVRLLNRSPGTVVIIRTANPKALTLFESMANSDWYSLQNDKILRAIFKGLNVHLVDAWEMVLAHHLPHNLHPQPTIIKNMIDVILSYICPRG